MPTYRIEVSPNNRATCKDTECKKNQEKILKGTTRFGTWVEIQDHASWAWKHWGCVSGAQIESLRELCDQGDGDYDFDAIDGFDEMEGNPELQQKVRRVVKQGHIDAEDFNGDPEKNRPGVKGIRLSKAELAKKERLAAEAEASEDDKPKKAKKGRKRAKDEDEDDEPQPKKAKKVKGAKPAKKVKDEEDDNEVEPEAEAAPKKRGKAAPAAKAAANGTPKPGAKKRGRPSKAKADNAVTAEESAEEAEEAKPAAKATKGRRRSAKT